MKLILEGHNEQYAAEQSLLALFPDERPVYGTAPEESDSSWARISLAQEGALCTAKTTIFYDGATDVGTAEEALAGDSYRQEGQRRKLLGLSFFRAACGVTGKAPPWGSLTGVRPDKVAARALAGGRTEAETDRLLDETYSVTPARRALAIETARAGLCAKASLGPKDVAVYIGIPFCPTRCAYCSFVSASVEKTFALVPPYLGALIEEIRSGGTLLRELGLRVRSFYMGGGTPTTLSADQMDRLLTAFQNAFDLSSCSEYTVEAGRPDTVTREKLEVLRRHGIGRISVNPQTMEDSVLRAIGRRHTAAEILAAMELTRAAGFEHINMDLIAGLPQDTPAGFRRSLDTVLNLKPDNITVHTLSLKRGSRLLTEGGAIPSAEEVGEMLSYASPALRAAGYVPYYLYRQKYMSGSFENVGWCRPGTESLYNICIMSELCSVFSMGAGGSTKMVDPESGEITRVFNLKYPKEYTERPEKMAANQAAFAAFYQHRKGDSHGLLSQTDQ